MAGNPNKKKEKKKVQKGWIEEILAIDGLSNLLSQNNKDKDKFDCLKCFKNGNQTYSSFFKTNIINSICKTS